MRLLTAFAVAVTACCAVLFVAEPPVNASCVAPTVTFKPARVARGSVLTITGQHFGDDCFDTGTVPPGVGVLGDPLEGMAIVINQGTNEFLLATGSADSDYAFEVEVVVPSALEPGEAFISVIGAGDARLPVSPALTISGNSPATDEEPTVVTFGPPTDTVPPDSVPPPILPAEIPDEPLATAPALLPVPVEVEDDDSSDRQRAIAVGAAGVVAIGAIGFAVWDRARRRRRY